MSENASTIPATIKEVIQRHPSLLGLHFHFINSVIPEVYPVKRGHKLYREPIVYHGFLLEACRNDDSPLKKRKVTRNMGRLLIVRYLNYFCALYRNLKSTPTLRTSSNCSCFLSAIKDTSGIEKSPRPLAPRILGAI